jgi:hypothetical protein
MTYRSIDHHGVRKSREGSTANAPTILLRHGNTVLTEL